MNFALRSPRSRSSTNRAHDTPCTPRSTTQLAPPRAADLDVSPNLKGVGSDTNNAIVGNSGDNIIDNSGGQDFLTAAPATILSRSVSARLLVMPFLISTA